MKIKLNTAKIAENVKNNNFNNLFSNQQNIKRLLCCLDYQKGEFNDPIVVSEIQDQQTNLVYSQEHDASFINGEYSIFPKVDISSMGYPNNSQIIGDYI